MQYQTGNLPCLVQEKVDKAKVAVICGGGSGHEPAHGGFVGKGYLLLSIWLITLNFMYDNFIAWVSK